MPTQFVTRYNRTIKERCFQTEAFSAFLKPNKDRNESTRCCVDEGSRDQLFYDGWDNHCRTSYLIISKDLKIVLKQTVTFLLFFYFCQRNIYRGKQIIFPLSLARARVISEIRYPNPLSTFNIE